MLNILLIDTDQNTRDSVTNYLRRKNHFVFLSDNFDDGFEIIKTLSIDIAFIETSILEQSGLDEVDRIVRFYPTLKIIAFGSGDNPIFAAQLMKHGVDDYLIKPLALQKLDQIIDKTEQAKKVEPHAPPLKEIKPFRPGFDDLITFSPLFKDILAIARSVSSSNSPVLITGPTGAGKGIIARAIQKDSPRRNKPFIEINTSAIPETLFESECFGYEAGAFTDARTSKKGLLELAHRGTVFLDEIGDIPLSVQSKFLKIIDGDGFYRLGGNEKIQIDVRIIASTNRNLRQMVQDGSFRDDLYYRLAVVTIVVPSLKERPEDIIPLIKEFMDEFSLKHDITQKFFTPEALHALKKYSWPGNIRELKNVVESMMIVSRGGAIEIGDLPSEITGFKQPMLTQIFEPQDIVTLEELEKEHIIRVLNMVNQNRVKAARILGISRTTLFEKIKKYMIKKDE